MKKNLNINFGWSGEWTKKLKFVILNLKTLYDSQLFASKGNEVFKDYLPLQIDINGITTFNIAK